jgi:hypothetical protein
MAEEKKDFVVKDRRIFAQDTAESDKQEEDKEAGSKTTEDKKPKEPRESRQAAASAEQEESPQLPEINFPTFIASLNAAALVHLGAIEDPAGGQKAKNMALAKQTIDILCMLQKKTEGNLTHDEENMLKNILYDLRIMYVKEKG